MCYALTLGHTGNGVDPVASPANSTGCTAGQYVSGETINLTAVPDSGYEVSGWSGTSNDNSTALTNTVSMPAAAHIAGVTYIQSIQTSTLTFQEGLNGYSGTVDTIIKQGAPTTAFGSLEIIEWDTVDTESSMPKYGLLRFDTIFGNGVGQIPFGSTIVSATLQYYSSECHRWTILKRQ